MRAVNGFIPAAPSRPLRTLAAWVLLVVLKLLSLWALLALFSGPVRAQELLPMPSRNGTAAVAAGWWWQLPNLRTSRPLRSA